MNTEQKQRLTELADAWVEDRLDVAGAEELEAVVRDHPEAQRLVADHLHTHASLTQASEDWLTEENLLEAESGVSRSNPFLTSLRYAAVVAFTALAVSFLLKDKQEGPDTVTNLPEIAEAPGESASAGPDTGSAPAPVIEIPKEEKDTAVATLIDTRASKWGGGTLPTQQGARLAPGRLNLLEGLATIKFDNGANLTIEAPAELEIENREKCRLINGAAVAWVPEQARGFQLVTDDALVTDYGTRFGVTAGGGDRPSEVLVLEGEVGISHNKAGGEEKRLKTGEMARYDQHEILELDPSDREPERRSAAGDHLASDVGWTVISTAVGNGKDSYVRYTPGKKEAYGTSPLVMSKWSLEREGNRRKTYLGFDLVQIKDRRIEDAQLVLDIQPSGFGYASLVPEVSQFSVYGLADESLDAWPENGLSWATAPANVAEGLGLDSEKVVRLGGFEIAQGVSSGSRSIGGPALAGFLNDDTNGIVTLIIIRETGEQDKMGLVHAFASKEHPVAAPPALRLKLAD